MSAFPQDDPVDSVGRLFSAETSRREFGFQRRSAHPPRGDAATLLLQLTSTDRRLESPHATRSSAPSTSHPLRRPTDACPLVGLHRLCHQRNRRHHTMADPSSSTAADMLSSTADMISSTAGDWLASSTGYSNATSSTGAGPVDLFGSDAPNGMVAYGVICFLTVLVFTAFIVWYYARPKLPPMVGVLTFLAWSHDDDTPAAAASAGDSNRCRRASMMEFSCSLYAPRIYCCLA
jgi:hypothetical protein